MSFESNGSQSSQTQPIPLSDFLSIHDDHHFVWDDANREVSDDWLAPVEEAYLDPKKHKVFHHSSKEYLTPPSPFVQQGPELGDSGSTIVYRVTSPEGYAYRRPLALKVIVCKENSRPPGPDSKARSDALKEVRTMSSLRHPHIVAYVASFEDYCIQTREIKRRQRGKAHAMLLRVNQRIKKHILGIAMYPPAQCNLHTFMDEVIQSPKEAGWILPHLHTYFGCLAQAVAYLHRQSVRVRHKDIKPDNIVIDDFGLPVLTDFGLSKHFEKGQDSVGPTPKTLKYADPEAMHEDRRDERSDIFSLGCVFLEMATVLLGQPAKFAEDQLSIDNNSGSGDSDAQSISSSGTVSGEVSAEFKYSQSLHNLDNYLKTLTILSRDLIAADPSREASVKAVLATLPYIRRMMDETQARRPEAHQLYPWFRHLCDVYDTPGPCPNCEEERRTGRAIPSRSGSRSPTLNRSGTAGTVGGGSAFSQPLVRRGTTASMATTMSVSMQ
ncbi:kinase-like domain-containing protein [Chaetomium fimeti]|uniref:non-specific serine/threonine protein kinase n=1 Tax=Chaetomium fimeti TaxID=1854472 RepID=A0AAE0HA02_9PEZI|nr:kinase-like domain-containing protein [Chaetomium fimeti]